ncbi:MAG: hypothetical protein LQ346_005885 [Caloplaca aetnensis]|nr:MAG: hypothetical protein LQ346_005885 [Caloplaca aetnensis]
MPLFMHPKSSSGVAFDPEMRATDSHIRYLRACSTHIIVPPTTRHLRSPLLACTRNNNAIITAPAANVEYTVPTPSVSNPQFFTNDEHHHYHTSELLNTLRHRRRNRRDLDLRNKHLNLVPGERGPGRWRIPKAPRKRDMVIRRIRKRKLREVGLARKERLLGKGKGKEDPVVVLGDSDEETRVVIKISKEDIRREMAMLEMKRELEMLEAAQ